MNRRLRALLLATCVACAMPAATTPASAGDLIDEVRDLIAQYAPDLATGESIGNCQFVAFRDPTDVQGQQTWVELTSSVFVGTPDVTAFEVTCWLQDDPDLGTGELPNTRHTCSATAAVGACANPVFYETDDGDNVYFCEHSVWTESTVGLNVSPDLLDHLVRDLFSTGGLTTMGGFAQIQATVVLAVSNLVATLTGSGSTQQVTVTVDADEDTPGVQCSPVLRT